VSSIKIRLDTKPYRFQFVESAECSPAGGCSSIVNIRDFDDFMAGLWTAMRFIQGKKCKPKKRVQSAPFRLAPDKPGSVGYLLP
jgi:hypothetical protein